MSLKSLSPKRSSKSDSATFNSARIRMLKIDLEGCPSPAKTRRLDGLLVSQRELLHPKPHIGLRLEEVAELLEVLEFGLVKGFKHIIGEIEIELQRLKGGSKVSTVSRH